MYRCLVRTTRTLRRNGTSLNRSKKYTLTFRRYTSISHNFKRNLSYNAQNLINRNRKLLNKQISITPTASILLSNKDKRAFTFNPSSTNPHRANDTVHTGSLGK